MSHNYVRGFGATFDLMAAPKLKVIKLFCCVENSLMINLIAITQKFDIKC